MSSARMVLALFDRGQRWKLVLIVAAMVATGLVQAAGVASVMPFVGLIANPDLVNRNEILGWLFAALGFTDARTFLLFVGFLVLLLIAASNGFLAFTTWVSLRFIWSSHHRISERLLQRYLAKPYSYFLGRHTSRLSKTLLAEVKEVIKGVVVPAMEVLSRSITTLMVVALLFVVDPKLAIVAASGLGGAYALVYVLVRRRQRELGAQRLAAATSRFKIASEAFGGIKDVKVLGREAHFATRFRAPSLEYSMARAANSAVGQIPGFALETLAFGGIIGVLLFLLYSRESLDQVLPLIALYAFAGSRLMPSLHQIFAGLTKIRFHAAALEALYADLLEPDATDAATEGAEPGPDAASTGRPALTTAIRFRNVSFRYPRSRRLALRNVDLVIPAKSKVGLVGPTGSGKTTVVDLVLGLFGPTEGEILVDGVPLLEAALSRWRARVGYVPQAIFLADDTIRRNIVFGIPDEQVDPERVARAARAAHLHDFVASLPAGYDTIVGERGVLLSGGERQRIGIARALYHDPDVLVLDEATSALDSPTEEAVMLATRELARDRTIIVIAHRLRTVQDCDMVYVLADGAVSAKGTYAELAANNAAFRQLAGMY